MRSRDAENRRERTLVFAHRGSGPRGPEPENTLAAFGAAFHLGADGVELDVRRSSDAQLVVHHDARLADGSLVCSRKASELPSETPLLGEALDACRGLIVNVEIKNFPTEPDFDPSQQVAVNVARLLLARRGSELDRHVIVSSFSRETLRVVTFEGPGLETAWLTAPGPGEAEMISLANADGLSGIHPHYSLVQAGLVAAAHSAGLRVRAWTVDDADTIAELGRFGIDAVVTNDVALALSVLEKSQLAKEPSGREQSGA
ncbi:MAG: glycerophosphodiester phosphodiesterase [Acidimicrobiales bacterium]